MNTITDVNKNIEASLSGVHLGEQKSSVLGSLFSINIESDDITSVKKLTDTEFVFDEDEIKILEYITNIIPNFEINKDSLPTIKQIEKQIGINENLNDIEKNKVLNFIKLGLTNLKEFKIEVSSNRNFKKILNNNSIKPFDNKNQIVETNIKNIIPPNNKKNFVSTNNEKKFVSSNDINIINNNSENDKSLNIKNKLNINNDKSDFVRKIKKNDHPNKIYQLSQGNVNKYYQPHEMSSQLDIKAGNNVLVNPLNNHVNEINQKNKINETNYNQNLATQQLNQISNSPNNFSQNSDSSFSNNGYNSVLENFLDNLDLTQKGWTSKLVSRIENAIVNGGEEIEFNLKPKNLGVLKISVTLKDGIGSVKIITENSFVTSALNQNENYLQKLFSDQGINLEFSAKNENQFLGSKNNSNQNSKHDKQNKNEITEQENETQSEDNSTRHIINVIA